MKQKNHLNEAKPHFERSNPGWRPHGADGIGSSALITVAILLASNIAMRLMNEASHTVTANSPVESEAISPRSVLAAGATKKCQASVLDFDLPLSEIPTSIGVSS